MKHVPSGTPVTEEAIDKMSYLNACVKEGFRYDHQRVHQSRANGAVFLEQSPFA